MATGSKTGGREAGTPNKVTKELRENLKQILEQEIEQLPALLNKLQPLERLNIIAKLLPYTIAKPAIEKDPVSTEPIRIIWQEQNTELKEEIDKL